MLNVQKKINQTLPAGLDEDGKWGPKTRAVWAFALFHYSSNTLYAHHCDTF